MTHSAGRAQTQNPPLELRYARRRPGKAHRAIWLATLLVAIAAELTILFILGAHVGDGFSAFAGDARVLWNELSVLDRLVVFAHVTNPEYLLSAAAALHGCAILIASRALRGRYHPPMLMAYLCLATCLAGVDWVCYCLPLHTGLSVPTSLGFSRVVHTLDAQDVMDRALVSLPPTLIVGASLLSRRSITDHSKHVRESSSGGG